MHFINHGYAENRPFSPVLLSPTTIHNGVDFALVYDMDDYLALNPDLYAIFSNDDAAALAHFVNNGMGEGRQASINFNVRAYRELNPDLSETFGNDLRAYFMHFINFGHAEGRSFLQ